MTAVKPYWLAPIPVGCLQAWRCGNSRLVRSAAASTARQAGLLRHTPRVCRRGSQNPRPALQLLPYSAKSFRRHHTTACRPLVPAAATGGCLLGPFAFASCSFSIIFGSMGSRVSRAGPAEQVFVFRAGSARQVKRTGRAGQSQHCWWLNDCSNTPDAIERG